MSWLEINYGAKEGKPMEMYDVQERLALTEDDRLVSEGHADARWLYAIPGRPIPMAEAIKYGLVAKAPKAAKPVESSADPKVAADKRGRHAEKKA